MSMGQPLSDMKDVWLPRALDVTVGLSLASGPFELRYALDYHDYRRPDVSSKVQIKDP
jgi:hypothetical protein